MDHRIADMLSRWEAQGGKPTAQDLCAGCPELIPVVEEGMRRLKRIGRLMDGATAGGTLTVPPPVLEGYTFLRLLGAGGMGTVWEAAQLGTGRHVAVKYLSGWTALDGQARARFEREVKLAAAFTHPGLVRIYDSGLHLGAYFYVMELVDGIPLDEFVAKRKLDRAAVLKLMVSVCRAVGYAHERKVIHRDLKPANILVDPDGQPHVLDFGLAKQLSPAGGPERLVSADGDIAGTPAYMSPEQAAGKVALHDPRSDVYSLGAILYQLMTGRLPHDTAVPPAQLYRQIIAGVIRPPRELDRSIGPALDALIRRALSRDPRQRYQNASTLADGLEGCPAGSRPQGGQRPGAAPGGATTLARPADPDRVEVKFPDGTVRHFPITSPRTVVGRSADAHVRIDSERISRYHAEILRDPYRRWWVRDLKSRNGVRVNGVRVPEQMLAPGDLIQLSHFSLRLLRPDAAEPVAPAPDGEPPLESRTLDPDAAPPVTAQQLDKLLSFSERLIATDDPGRRRGLLCHELTAEWFGGLAALVLRGAAGTDSLGVICRVDRAGSPGNIHVSRSLLRAMRTAAAPVVGSNASRREGMVEFSLDRSVMAAAAIACPLDGPEGDTSLYVAVPPDRATPEWLALAALACRQFAHAEAVWRERERKALHDSVERDLEQARNIQRQFLPRASPIERFAWDFRFEPCRWVGGDYLDVFPLPDGRVFVAVADVAGKGPQAALITASIHTLVRTVMTERLPLHTLFQRAHDYLHQFLPANSFVTMSALLVDPAAGTAQYCNAGHPPPLCLWPDGHASPLPAELNLPLGVEPEPFVCETLALQPGQTLVLYSDGCTDVINPAGTRLSVPHLQAMLRETAASSRDRSPETLLEGVFQRLETHRGPCLPPDDRALVAFALTG